MKPFLLLALAAGTTRATTCNGNLTDPSRSAVDARVELINVLGGCWVLETDSGKRYEPIQLAPEFQRDGLEVTATLATRSDVGSYCMVGELVEILTIRVR